MKGTIELKVIEKPDTLRITSGKNNKLYVKILATLDVMSATKCISISPDEIRGKNIKAKIVNLRGALNRSLVQMKKGYTAAAQYDDMNDVVYVWSRVIVK